MKKQNTVSFSDIFNYTTEHFGMHWNKCNDVFFDKLFKFRGYSNIELDQMKWDLENGTLTEDDIIARKSIVKFMEKNKVKKMVVLGD